MEFAETYLNLLAPLLYSLGSLITALGMLGALYSTRTDQNGVNVEPAVDRDEQEADRKRTVGGYVYSDVVWESLGKVERVKAELLNSLVSDDPTINRKQVKAQIDTLDDIVVLHRRLLNFRDSA